MNNLNVLLLASLLSCAVPLAAFSLKMAGDRIPLMAGNWKMNTDLRSAVVLATELAALTSECDPRSVEVAVVPPSAFLRDVSKALSLKSSNIKLGGQAASSAIVGAYTGAISAPMLKSVGCSYVLVGHSERRAIFGETDSDINLSVKNVYASKMTPILCVGETLEEYELGLCKEVCTIQVCRALADVAEEDLMKLVIAYEPVWAIGTGKVATPEIAQSVHKDIRDYLRRKFGGGVADAVRIQYGGSVTPDSVDALMACPDIDGALVGGASLKAESFARIANFKII